MDTSPSVQAFEFQGNRLPFVAASYGSPTNYIGAHSPLFSTVADVTLPGHMPYPFLNLIDFTKTGSRSSVIIPSQASPTYGAPYLSAMEIGLLAARSSPMFGSMPSSPSYGLSPLNSPNTNTAIPVIGKPQLIPFLPTAPASQNPGLPPLIRIPSSPGNPLASMAQVPLPPVTTTVTSVANTFLRRLSSAEGTDDDKSEPFGRQSDDRKESKMPHIKKPLNAFMLYMKEMRPQVMAEVGLKERQSAEINRILGRRWHMLNKQEQQKYYDMARKERELHMEKYPGWSARDNYAVHKKKKRKKDKSHDNSEMKKCRARFGLDQQSKWCKHCKRKKKCLWFKDSDADGTDIAEQSPPSQVSSTTQFSAVETHVSIVDSVKQTRPAELLNGGETESSKSPLSHVSSTTSVTQNGNTVKNHEDDVGDDEKLHMSSPSSNSDIMSDDDDSEPPVNSPNLVDMSPCEEDMKVPPVFPSKGAAV
ncbi:unnamed protein product [Soboliphyme baturini]|uniref:dTCF n=1 Tax=Soboliphyme baturini TaxID=241478 RepID=A0A183IU99_9BILA|nr:unnamed protein product [Soboliphyme baturini]